MGPADAIILASDLRALIESVAPAVGGDDDLLPGGVSMGAISLRLSSDLLSAQASDRYIVLRNAVRAPSRATTAAAFSIPAVEVKPLVAALRKEGHVLLFVAEGEVSIVSTQEDRPPLGSFRADEAATVLWKSLSHVQYAQGEQMNGQERSVIPIARLSAVLAAAKKVSPKGSLVESLPGYLRSPVRFVHTRSEHWEAIVMPDAGPISAA